ncbi:MAG: iron chaperone [Candidatus Binatia bacterium]
MRTKPQAAKDIDGYIAKFPNEVQKILEKIRMTIKKAPPQAQETIGYQMPAFALKGHLVYFAALKNHIGFYPPVTGEMINSRKRNQFIKGPRAT